MQEIFRHGQGLRRRVLVVDDEFVNRAQLGAIVERDHDVIYAENGIQAMKLIRENAQTLSLVLLDLLMPEMNGYEVLKELHADPALYRIPVIVLTSERDAEVESLHLGAYDFLHKPYDMPEVIRARVDRAIELAEDKLTIRETENDPLTGLYTRDFFLYHARRHDQYYPGMPMDAVSLNINRVHFLSELYGRALMDDLLKAVGSAISRFLDGASGLACRCDLDQFYLYLPHREDYRETLVPAITAAADSLSHTRVTIRVGVYPNVDAETDMEQRLARADIAAARLQDHYHSDVFCYDNQLHKKELFDERLLTEMDQALSEKQFQVYYQPKYRILGGRPMLAGAEALIRWFHPKHGMISPGVFIPLFEQHGLIYRLDRYVWREAASQIRAWRDRYGITLPVSVNVSRVNLLTPTLVPELRSLAEEAGLEPRELHLEITESAYTEHADQIVETVGLLRKAGFYVEMDDFGSGYSSLNMLTILPIDALKLDMGFIRKIDQSPRDFRMVELMLDIAKYLNVPVIAEGVENEKQYQLLKQAACDIIQGYYFSRPLPAREFAPLIEKELTERA